MNEKKREEAMLWRYSILGPLVSARLEHGDLGAECRAAANRRYKHPDGREIKVSSRTIETWYYAYRAHGLEGLRPSPRKDKGAGKGLSEELKQLIVRAKRERPRRSVRRIIKILERAKRVIKGQLSRSVVHRLLVEHGANHRPDRPATRERRSFLVESPGDLWVGDVMHGPRVLCPDGKARKSYLVSIMDAATRYMVASEFRLSEQATDHESVLKQALKIYGRPRTYYVDLGSAYVAGSLKYGCAVLGIHLLHTAPRDAQAKGSIERWHRTWRDEVGDELGDEPLSLEAQNAKHWAWLRHEYHAREHSTTKRSPQEHLLSQDNDIRDLPTGVDLDEAFWRRTTRKVRNDGTVRFQGMLLEVDYTLVGRQVELRFDPQQDIIKPKVFVDDNFVCDTVVMDLLANATRRRKRTTVVADPSCATGINVLEDLEAELDACTKLVHQNLKQEEEA